MVSKIIISIPVHRLVPRDGEMVSSVVRSYTHLHSTGK